jgi:hypothetical protein
MHTSVRRTGPVSWAGQCQPPQQNWWRASAVAQPLPAAPASRHAWSLPTAAGLLAAPRLQLLVLYQLLRLAVPLALTTSSSRRHVQATGMQSSQRCMLQATPLLLHL